MQETESFSEAPIAPEAPDNELYSERALWLCTNRKTAFKTRIHGALAEILAKYPKDYKLKFLRVEGGPHEHLAATGE